MITQSEVWAAAAAAWRVNGSYVKETTWIDSESDPELSKTTIANKHLVRSYLTEKQECVTDEDRELGELARSVVGQEYSYRILVDSKLTDFDRAVLYVLNIQQWDKPDPKSWAIIASQIGTYFRLKKNKEVRVTLSSGYLGQPKEKITTDIKVLRCSWSREWNVIYVIGVTKSNHLVRFPFRESLKEESTYQIQGTVKYCGTNGEYGADVTILNRVKLLETT